MFHRTNKRAVNLSLDASWLREAGEWDINLSAPPERALWDVLRHERRARWVAENRPSIQGYNTDVETYGTYADKLRTF